MVSPTVLSTMAYKPAQTNRGTCTGQKNIATYYPPHTFPYLIVINGGRSTDKFQSLIIATHKFEVSPLTRQSQIR